MKFIHQLEICLVFFFFFIHLSSTFTLKLFSPLTQKLFSVVENLNFHALFTSISPSHIFPPTICYTDPLQDWCTQKSPLWLYRPSLNTHILQLHTTVGQYERVMCLLLTSKVGRIIFSTSGRTALIFFFLLWKKIMSSFFVLYIEIRLLLLCLENNAVFLNQS